MKKVLSLFLTFATVFTLLAIPTMGVSAEEPAKEGIYDVAKYITTTTEPEDTRVEINGQKFDKATIGTVEYVVLESKAQFMALKAQSITQNLILKNNIDLDGALLEEFYIKLSGGVIFEGNGFSLLNYSQKGYAGYGGLFNANSAVEFTVKNITIGSNSVPIKMTPTKADGMGVLVGKSAKSSSVITFENVTVYVDFQDTTYKRLGGFVGLNQGTLNLYNCKVYGDVTTTDDAVHGVGGFVGMNSTGGNITVKNCINHATVSCKTGYAGGLIGRVYEETKVTVNGFINKATVSSTDEHTETTPSIAGAIFGVDEVGITAQNAYTTVDMSNLNGATVAEQLDAANKAYVQYTEPTAGKRDYRVLISMDEAYLDQITDITLTVTYTLTNGKTKVAELKGNALSYFAAVTAAGKTYVSADGKVLLAAVITGVPDDAWTAISVDLTVDGTDAAETAYNGLDATETKANILK